MSIRGGRSEDSKSRVSDYESEYSDLYETNEETHQIYRHRDIQDHTHQTKTTIPIGATLFSVSPTEVVFENYEPFKVYTATISLRNRDSVARRCQIIPPTHHQFQLSAPIRDKNQMKVAPGMELKYTLTFKPITHGDSKIDLHCLTEREEFIIPVRASGDRAFIDFPRLIEFSGIPINHVTRQPLLLRNTGNIPTRFSVVLEPPFSSLPEHGELGIQEATQVTLLCNPKVEGLFEAKLRLDLENDVQLFADLRLDAKSARVFLEKSEVTLPQTYMDLASQASITLCNASDVPVKFCWKTTATLEEENERFRDLEEQLKHGEAGERAAITNNGIFERGLELDDDSSDGEELQKAFANQNITRKYKKLNQQLQESESLVFSHPNFEIHPLQGEIYPGGISEISVIFKPSASTDYKCLAYCDVTGVQNRLALTLSGSGVGPKAAFNYSALDIGDVFINAIHRYSIVIKNLGDIDALFSLQQSNKPSRFKFTPDKGKLGLGKQGTDDILTISIEFISDSIGEFNEIIVWELAGSTEPLKVTFKGKVIGPTFAFEETELDFGVVAHGFLNTRYLSLKNTSEIPLDYRLRIPEDGKFMQREFGIEPFQATILPNQTGKIRVDFVSETVKRYDNYTLFLDIDGVGEGLQIIPIKASCVISEVTLGSSCIDFGDCFLRYKYNKSLPISNDSDLFAKFEVQVQDENSLAIAKVTPEQQGASVPPKSTFELNFSMVVQRLGHLSLPLFFHVPGSGKLPITIMAKVHAIGPKVTLDQQEIKFGTIPVLQDVTIPLVLHNESPIPAFFKAFIHKKGSVFTITDIKGHIEPNAKFTMNVVAHLNETLKLTDTLHILVNEGEDLEIPLSAKGSGTVIFSPDLSPARIVDHGNILTNAFTAQLFQFHNKGRRTHTLIWEYVPPPRPKGDEDEKENGKKGGKKKEEKGKDSKDSKKKESKKDGKDDKEKESDTKNKDKGKDKDSEKDKSGKTDKKGKEKEKEEEKEKIPESIFKFTPNKIVLEPNNGIEFQVDGRCATAGPVVETWVCNAVIGSGKKPEPIYTIQVCAVFVNPLLQFSRDKITFQSLNDPTNPVMPQQESLTIKNVSALPLNFQIKCPSPFSVDRLEYQLQPGEAATTMVQFMANLGTDKTSAKIKANMKVSYRDHAQRDRLPLFGEICYPNMSFEEKNLNFGCILNNTSKRIVKRMTNTSQIACAYQWVFNSNMDYKGKGPKYDANEIFDVTPIRGILQPGEFEDVEFVFFAHEDSQVKAVVYCEVIGGPDYPITLTGRASNMSYKIDCTDISFGPKELLQQGEKTFTIQNNGRVAFPYFVVTNMVRHPVVTVSPMSGNIKAGEKAKINVKFNSALPDVISEKFEVCIAYFDPVEINVTAIGVYPQVNFFIPRDETQLFQSYFAAASEEAKRVAYLRNLSPQERLDLQHSPNPPSVNYLDFTSNQRPATSESTVTNSAGYAPVELPAKVLALNPNVMLEVEADRRLFMDYSLLLLQKEQKDKEKARRAAFDKKEKEKLGQTLGATQGLEKTSGGMKADGKKEASRKEKDKEKEKPKEKSTKLEKSAEEKPVAADNAFADSASVVDPSAVKDSDSSELSRSKGVETSDAPPSEDSEALSASELKIDDETEAQVEDPIRIFDKEKSLQLLFNEFPKRENFIVSTHILDFSNVILGTNKKKTFKVTNVGGLLVTFDMSKRHFIGSVFSMEPLTVVRLPPGQSVDFTALVSTSARRNKEKPEKVIMPVSVRNAPGINIEFRANITVPDVRISQTNIDFGCLYLGNQKQIFIQLLNFKEVPCDWEIRPFMGQLKDREHFSVTPTSGNLLPGARVNLTLSFTPVRVGKFSIQVPLKVSMNSSKQIINLKGKSKAVSLNFLPSLVQLGPVLPYQTSQPFEVKMINTSECDVEVYSLDFDKKYLFEEEMLAGEEYLDGFLYAEPRCPGDNLPDTIVANHRKREIRRKREEEARRIAEEKNEIEKNKEKEKEGDSKRPDGGVGKLEGVGAALEEARKVAEETTPINILIYGPPFSGQTTLATSIGEKFGIADSICDLDTMVKYFTNLLEEEVDEPDEKKSAKPAKAGKKGEVKVEEVKVVEDPHISPEEKALAKDLQTKLNSFREEQKKLEELKAKDKKKQKDSAPKKASKKEKKAKGKAGEKSKGEEEVSLSLLGSLDVSLLSRIIQMYIMRDDGAIFEKGIIIDGLQNSYVEHRYAARALKDAFQATSRFRDNNLHVIILHSSESDARLRIAQLEEKCKAIIAEPQSAALKRFKPISQKEREKLNDAKRAAYDEVYPAYAAREKAEAMLETLQSTDLDRIVLFFSTSEDDDAPRSGRNSATPALLHEKDASSVSSNKSGGDPISTDKVVNVLAAVKIKYAQPVLPDIADEESERSEKHDENQPAADHINLVNDILNVELPKSSFKWVKAHRFNSLDSHDHIKTMAISWIQQPFFVEENAQQKDQSWVPPPKIFHLYPQPKKRKARPPIKGFYLVQRVEKIVPVETEDEEPEKDEKKKAPSKKDTKKGTERAPTPSEVIKPLQTRTEVVYEPLNVTRWSLPPMSETTLLIQFHSPETGVYSFSMDFEIQDSAPHVPAVSLQLRGVCAAPEIARDPRSVFMRRTKMRKNGLSRMWIQSEGVFEFGALLKGRNPDSRLLFPPQVSGEDGAKGGDGNLSRMSVVDNIEEPSPIFHAALSPAEVKKQKALQKFLRKTYATVFRISNVAPFPVRVDFALRDAVNSIKTDTAVDLKTDKGGGKDKKGVAAPKKVEKKSTKKDDTKKKAKTAGKGQDAAKAAQEEEMLRRQEELKTRLVFSVEPEDLELQIDESRDVTVWAFPQEVGDFEDALVCSIQDNPIPIVFPLRCSGARPVLDLSSFEIVFERLLQSRSETKIVNLSNTSSVAAMWKLDGLEALGTQFNITPNQGVLAAGLSIPISVQFNAMDENIYNHTVSLQVFDTEEVLGMVDEKTLTIQAEAFKLDVIVDVPDIGLDFGTVRVGQEVTREFTINNVGKYDVKYQFVTAPRMAKMFDIINIEPRDGHLEKEEHVISVTVQTTKEESFVQNGNIRLQLVEAGSDSLVKSLPLLISCQSVFSKYRIIPPNSVAFGPLEKGTSQARKIKIMNEGEFEFTYRIFPADPQHPYSRANTVLTKEYLEAKAKEKEEEAAKNLAKKTPVIRKGGKEAKGAKKAAPKKVEPKKVEVKAKPASKKAATKTSKGKRGKGDSVFDIPDELSVGCFTIFPCTGTIEKGQSADLSVKMLAGNSGKVADCLEIVIEQRDEANDPIRVYELTGESCSPGIDCTSWGTIFEEQSVRVRLDPNAKAQNHFAIGDRVFQFMPVIAAKPDASLVERFQIKNPFKIPCKVDLRIKMPGFPVPSSEKDDKKAAKAAAKGGKDKKESKGSAPVKAYLPFTVEPESLLIPSHEHRNATVTFNPTSLESHSAIFEAVVVGGSDPNTNILTFELRGEGTLPHLTVLQPRTMDPDRACPLLEFPQLFCDTSRPRSYTLPIVVKNEGIVPSTARFDVQSTGTFSFSGQGKMITIDPGQVHQFDVIFRPTTVGSHSCELKMSVLDNPFEVTNFLLKGTSYTEDVTVEGIDMPSNIIAADRSLTPSGSVLSSDDTSPEINFGDVTVSSETTRSFTIVNHSTTNYKFQWQTFSVDATGKGSKAKAKTSKPKKGDKGDFDGGESRLVFSPSQGHLQPKSSKTITVTFSSDKSVKYSMVPLRCTCYPIQYLTRSEIENRSKEEKKGKADKKSANKKTKKESSKKPGKAGDRNQQSEDEDDIFEKSREEDAGQEEDLKAIDWDDSLKVAKFVLGKQLRLEKAKEDGDRPPTRPGKKKIEKKVGGKVVVEEKDDEPVDIAMPGDDEMVQVIETAPEPMHDRVGTKETEVSVRVSVTADKCRYELTHSEIIFRPTMMYQVRVFKFPFVNTSSIALAYRWEAKSHRAEPERDEDMELEQPFLLEPTSGLIPPNETAEFKLSFSPGDSIRYHTTFTAQIANLADNLSPPTISVKSEGQRPTCHFELTQSDYLLSHRRRDDMPGPNGRVGPLDMSYKVIEFKSLGTSVRNTRRFYIQNPTNVHYGFEFICEDPGNLPSYQGKNPPGPRHPFRCLTQKGMVESGRKFEMVFEFTPDINDLVESFWRFVIPQHNIEMPVLLVGSVAEPEVVLNTAHINFHANILNRTAKQVIYLKNSEHLPFSFSVDPAALSAFNEEGAVKLKMTPSSGVVGPESTLPINIFFTPLVERQFNWNMEIAVKKKSVPLFLNVKGEGYAIKPHLELLEEKDSHFSVPLRPNGVNALEFGSVHIHERRCKQIIINNTGSFAFDFQWNLPVNRFVTITPLAGNVMQAGRAVCDVTFHTKVEAALDSLLAACTIANTMKYSFELSGRGRKPALDFSFLKYDFGKCFIHDRKLSLGRQNVHPVTSVLRITNVEAKNHVALDCLFSKTNFFDAEFTPTVLAPNGGSIDVPISFSPSEMKVYSENIPFEVNGLYNVIIAVSGEGVPLKLALVTPSHGNILFEYVNINQQVSQQLVLANNSKKDVQLALFLRPSILMGSNQNASTSAMIESQDAALSLNPEAEVLHVVRRKERMVFDVQFYPQTTLDTYVRDVVVVSEGIEQRVATITASCQGMAIHLSNDKVVFGNVVAGASMARKIHLSNSGGTAVRFEWATAVLENNFTLSPISGVLPPHHSTNFEIIFHPKEPHPDVRVNKLQCFIDGAPAEGVSISLSGVCVPVPVADAKLVEFQTKVRQSCVKPVTITNSTNNRWVLEPVLQGQYFSGAHSMLVPANSSVDYQITYSPTACTIDIKDGSKDDKKSKSKSGTKPATSSGSQVSSRPSSREDGSAATPSSLTGELPERFHKGTLLFPLPNGEAVCFQLQGVSQRADAENHIEASTPSKKLFVQDLVVKNWLNTYQRFAVQIESDSKDNSMRIWGPPTLDVPPLVERKYKLSFFSLKVGSVRIVVRMTNPQTQEKLFYTLNIKAMESLEDSSIPPLQTTVRSRVTYRIPIKNPLEDIATFTEFSCKNPGIRVPLPVQIRSQELGHLELQYLPLTVSESKEPEEALLQLTSPTLGTFSYKLFLTAMGSAIESDMTLRTFLGSETVGTFRFLSYAPRETVYECSLDSSDFTVEPRVTVAAMVPGQEPVPVSLEVRYEPSAVGDARALLKVTSQQAGEYTCVLKGICDPPKPQGPILITTAGGVIRFRNVLDTPETFVIAVDNPCFLLAGKDKLMKIAQKTVAEIKLAFKPEADKKNKPPPGKTQEKQPEKVMTPSLEPTAMGKLLITCPAIPGITWVYYLNGRT